MILSVEFSEALATSSGENRGPWRGRKGEVVKRAQATRRLEELLDRVVRGQGHYLPRVDAIWVFGSYARGALEVGDVDLAVEFEQSKDEAARWQVSAMMGGADHMAAFARELRGNQRALQLQFNQLGDLVEDGFSPVLLWRRGDSYETALARLGDLAIDPAAGRAVRDGIHPLLAPVEKLIPRSARQQFSLFAWAGWLDAQLVELPEAEATHAVTRRRFALQWSETNPRLRAAHVVASYLEQEGIAPLSAGGTLHSDERETVDSDRNYWRPRVSVHFGGRLLEWAMLALGQGTPRVLVVLNPTARKQPVLALDVRAVVDRNEFFEFQYGGAKRELLERVLEAERSGTLPDYMHDLAESVRARLTDSVESTPPAPPG
jgi:predicted nucleotidyltransferase